MKLRPVLLTALALAVCLGCRDSGRKADTDHHDEATSGNGHRHEHHAPHGGTVVILGNEEFHLEFVRDARAGSLTAYVLDREMENFVRLSVGFFTVKARVDGNEHLLRFEATSSRATGEKPGDTSMFVAQADWLKTCDRFEAVLESLEIRGHVYREVQFVFPVGNAAAPQSRS